MTVRLPFRVVLVFGNEYVPEPPKIRWLNVVGAIVAVVPVYSTVPVEGVNVPVTESGVPVPVRP